MNITALGGTCYLNAGARYSKGGGDNRWEGQAAIRLGDHPLSIHLR